MVVLCCYAVAGAPEVPLGTVSLRKRFERRTGGVPTLPHILLLSIDRDPSLVQRPDHQKALTALGCL